MFVSFLPPIHGMESPVHNFKSADPLWLPANLLGGFSKALINETLRRWNGSATLDFARQPTAAVSDGKRAARIRKGVQL